MTDPIADMLTRIRNANQMRNKEVAMPTSKMKLEIASELGPLNLKMGSKSISFGKDGEIPASLGGAMSKKLVQMGEEILLREYNNKNNL